MGIGKVSSLAAASLSKVNRLAKLSIGKISGFTASFAAAFSNTYSIDFDGADDYISVGNQSELVITGDVSISAWIKMDEHVDNASIVTMAGGDEAEGNNYLYRITMDTLFGNPGVKVGHEYGGGSNEFNTFNTNLQVDRWYSLIVVRSSSAKTWSLYVDGSLFSSPDSFSNNATGGDSAVFEIGRQGSYEFNGHIDDVSVWDSELSAAEVTQIYNSGTPIDLTADTGDYASSSNLVGYWKMEEGTGTTVADSSTNSNDGTLTNGPTWSTDTPDD